MFFPFKVKYKYNKGVKRGHQIRLVVQTLERPERSTSNMVPLAQEFSKPLVVRARDNSGSHTEEEKGKKIESGVKDTEERKKNIPCLDAFKWICYFERFRILEL